MQYVYIIIANDNTARVFRDVLNSLLIRSYVCYTVVTVTI